MLISCTTFHAAENVVTLLSMEILGAQFPTITLLADLLQPKLINCCRLSPHVCQRCQNCAICRPCDARDSGLAILFSSVWRRQYQIPTAPRHNPGSFHPTSQCVVLSPLRYVATTDRVMALVNALINHPLSWAQCWSMFAVIFWTDYSRFLMPPPTHILSETSKIFSQLPCNRSLLQEQEHICFCIFPDVLPSCSIAALYIITA